MRWKIGAVILSISCLLPATWIAASAFSLIDPQIAFPHQSRILAFALACTLGFAPFAIGYARRLHARTFSEVK